MVILGVVEENGWEATTWFKHTGNDAENVIMEKIIMVMNINIMLKEILEIICVVILGVVEEKWLGSNNMVQTHWY